MEDNVALITDVNAKVFNDTIINDCVTNFAFRGPKQVLLISSVGSKNNFVVFLNFEQSLPSCWDQLCKALVYWSWND